MSTTLADRFEIRRRLGDGAFGVVFEAYDRERDQHVALKRLRSLETGALRRFKREFRAAADIVHPNVIRLGELMHDGQNWFFTMELVEGCDLLSWVREDATAAVDERVQLGRGLRFDEARLRNAFAQLALGVSALHTRGLIHRDLKPANVMVTRGGRVVVLDFGLGQEVDAADSQRTAARAGTPAYMSPEQCVGEELGASSDCYSIGVMLYEALTGSLPFAGSMMQVMAQRLTGDAPAPGRVAPGVPPDLDSLCRELLCTAPGDRPTSADTALRFHAEVSAEPVTGPARAPAEDFFVGRDAQLDALRDALSSVRAGAAALVLVDGESGMGKTALARHFVSELRATDPRALILSGRCHERESVPFKAFDSVIDALSRFLDQLPQQEAEPLLPSDWAVLERLFPVLKDVGTAPWSRGTIEIADAQELRRRGFDALRELLRAIANRYTLVLFIDDLQWGDVDSGHLLRELMRPPQPPPILLLATYRREDAADSPLLRMVTEPRAGTRRWQLSIDALTPEETRALALARLGDDSPGALSRAETLARESLGSPFFIDELARFQFDVQEQSRTQLRLEAAIEARLGRLPDPARRLLEIIAVAGRPIDVQVANQAAGLDPRDTRHAELLHVEKWVRRRAGTERFIIEVYHDRLRENVVSLLPAERVASDQNALTAAWLASGVADAETLAEHYRSAGEPELAGRHALRAADQAADALAFDRAGRLYQLSLQLWQPQDPALLRQMHVRLAHTLVNAGRGADAAGQFLLAARSASEEDAFELTRAAAEQLLLSGRIDDGLTVLRRLLRTVGLRLARSPLHALPGIIGNRLLLMLRGMRWRPRRAAEISPLLLRRIDVAASVAIGLGMIDIAQRQRFQSINMLLSLRAGEPHRVARALMIEMAITSAGGSRTMKRTQRLQGMCRQIVEGTDQPYTHGFHAVVSGIVAYLAADFSGSLELSRRGQRILAERCTGVTWELDTAVVFELLSLLQLGRWREFADIAPGRFENARARNDAYLVSFFRARANYLLHLLDDDIESARNEQNLNLFQSSQSSYQLQHYWSWHASCEIELYAGQPAAALARLRAGQRSFQLSLLPLMTQAIRVEHSLLRARIVLALARSPGHRTGDSRRLLKEAERCVRSLEREQVSSAAAAALLVRAGVACTRGQVEETGTLAAAAAAAFEACGALHNAAAARWILGHALGGTAGDRVRADATAWMAAQGARAPDRMLSMLAPARFS